MRLNGTEEAVSMGCEHFEQAMTSNRSMMMSPARSLLMGSIWP
jgi:hypothetical protein